MRSKKCIVLCANCHCNETNAERAKKRKQSSQINKSGGPHLPKKDFIDKHVKNGPCIDCGKHFEIWQLEFHHRDPSTKFMNVSNMCSGRFTIEEIMVEIEKCDMVCCNCHRARTFMGKQNK